MRARADKIIAKLAKAKSMPKLPEQRARTRDEIRVDKILRQMANEPEEQPEPEP